MRVNTLLLTIKTIQNIFMKKFILFSALFALLVSATTIDKKGYTISGKIKAADGDTVILATIDYLSLIPLDTTIIKDGKFFFTGEQKEPVYRYITQIKNGVATELGSDLILENGTISVSLDKENKGAHGTANNELWREYTTQDNKISMKALPYWNVAEDSTQTDSVRAHAKKVIESVQREQLDYLVSFIRSHIKSGLSHLLFESYYQTLEPKYIEEILAEVKKAGIEDELYTTAKQKLDAMKKTTPGNQFTDIELNDQNGKSIKLSTIVPNNKITMIDFWASWCGPCRAEMPHVVELYKKYKSKGFEIVGVSLDKNKESWIKAIQTLNMPWPQISDLKGWKSKGAASYDITAIPATVLINQKGEIVAKNLRGEELSKKLDELLNQ